MQLFVLLLYILVWPRAGARYTHQSLVWSAPSSPPIPRYPVGDPAVMPYCSLLPNHWKVLWLTGRMHKFVGWYYQENSPEHFEGTHMWD